MIVRRANRQRGALGAGGDCEASKQDGRDRVAHVAMKRTALAANTRGRQREVASQQPIVIYGHLRG